MDRSTHGGRTTCWCIGISRLASSFLAGIALNPTTHAPDEVYHDLWLVVHTLSASDWLSLAVLPETPISFK